MKKISTLILCAAALLLAASCSKELISHDAEEGGSKLTVSVSLPDNATKTDIQKDDNAYKLLWSIGDCLYLNGKVSSAVSEEQAGKQKASFEFTGTFEAPYNLVYCGKEGSDDVVVFPSVQQTSTDRCIDENATPMYAAASTLGDLTLQHLNAILKFNFTGTQDLASIVVRARGGERLSGEFTIGKTEGLLNGTLTGGNSDCVTLDCHGFNLGSKNDFYVTVPAGDYSAGFDIYVVTTDASANVMKLKYKSEAASTLAAGRVYEFASKEFVANSEEMIIATPADLKTFATLAGTANVGVKAMIVNDIDMTGEEYSPWKGKMHDGVERTAHFNFYGTLDGCNHEIKGLTTPLINELYGQVKNLTIEANFDYDGNSGQTYGIGILAHYAKIYAEGGVEPLIDNVTTNGSLNYVDDGEPLAHAMIVGGLLGASNGVTVKNCTNNAAVTVSNSVVFASRLMSGTTTECMMCLGGVVGKLQTAATAVADNCCNNGEISYSGNCKARTFIGGVVGHNAKTTGAIKNCVNNGNVTVTADAVLDSLSYIGGAVGTAVCVTENNANTGKVTCLGAAKSGLWIGGVAGTALLAEGESTKYYGDVINYRNTGDISAAGSCSYLRLGGIVASVGDYSKKLLNNTNSGNIEVNTKCTSTCYVGGITSEEQPKVCTNNTSSGNIEIGPDMTCTYVFAGGLFGTTGSNATNILNCSTAEGTSITANNFTFTASTGFAIGGLVGKCSNFHVFQNSVNNTDIEIKAARNTGTAGRYDIGGIVGYVQIMASNGNANGLMKFDQTVNNGDIHFSASPTTASYVRAGGLIGFASSERQVSSAYVFDETITLDECVNNGDITFDDITGSKNINAGGLVGHDSFTKYVETSCVNNGDITVNGSNISGNALYQMNLGGHVGLIYRSRHTEASITGPDGKAANAGKITLNATNTLPVHPTAGGIVGSAVGHNTSLTAGTVNDLTMTITGCINEGEIISNLSGWTYDKTTIQNFTYSGYCGGIIGRATGPWDKASSASYTACLLNITDCINKADIGWGKRGPDFTSSWTGSYNSTFTGGIIGLAHAYRDAYPFTLNCCSNEGNILSYDGCCGGLVGYGHLYLSIIGTANNYCKNSGDVCYGVFSKPQAYTGGIIGWLYTGNKQVFRYLENSGNVLANAGVGGFVGYLTDNQQMTLEYFKNKGTIQSSTNSGKAGAVFGVGSSYAWLDGMWLPGMNYLALGGVVNAMNSAATTFTLQGTNPEGADYYLNLVGQYFNLDTKGYRYDSSTGKASTTEQATIKELVYEHLGPSSGKVCEFWDGVSKTSWEK